MDLPVYQHASCSAGFLLPPRQWSLFQVHPISMRSWLLLLAPVAFWGQMVIVVIGTTWCIALVCALFFGGWYAWTHPTTGNDRAMRKLARLLRGLTFGLTDSPFPETGVQNNTHQEAPAEQQTPRRSRCG